MAIDGNYTDVETLMLCIARSQIVLAAEPRTAMSAGRVCLLPAGFDEADVAILEWIAAEGRRAGRGIARL